MIGASPQRQRHGDSETEWDASGAWLEPLLTALAAAESSAAASSAGASIRRSKIRYQNAGDSGCDCCGGYC